ncbi:hypothetical protein [Halopseudomonas sp.]|uniref:hypothetical protein n=1 Tax=Halopseudomonas sp. TaxID=2901191 RepID=UPI003563F78B
MRTPNLKCTTLAISFIAASLVSATAAAQTPRIEPDGSWISLSGEIENPGLNTFVLNYGDGSIVVEMDDWDRDADAAPLLDGDNVTVYGRVDQNLFTDTTIEASSVYVESLGTYFYASSVDEEEFVAFDLTPTVPIVVGAISYTGTVSSVDGRKFTLNTGNRSITIDTNPMDYNPMDEVGYQQVEEGDVASVYGSMNTGVIGSRKLMANAVVTRYDNAQ